MDLVSAYCMMDTKLIYRVCCPSSSRISTLYLRFTELWSASLFLFPDYSSNRGEDMKKGKKQRVTWSFQLEKPVQIPTMEEALLFVHSNEASKLYGSFMYPVDHMLQQGLVQLVNKF